MKFEKENVRPILIYLVFIAIILGVVGVFIMQKDFSGQAVKSLHIYSIKEIREHNSEEDCWIYFYRNVYDITLFLQIYPEDLNKNCGRELDFADENLLKSLEQYQIGFVE